ncbi:protein-disulfide reductase DsbD family protein [Alisedimentitalea sp. MJ-SS2]|uniref:protein-disulfide reductase DsbD domain-containing protein n=1 Tax=Aliisedimentitalea sp. MJ-SS2 TaxID=3049795 RepID=UPI00290FB0E5|nr:protein-disulfide reductase DsbD domain-containing protein [Alisedimentitalea sp. MJ-SS2]MDU8928247.1 protein-disulfide reductase DsbD family protein [Alisedimentitalea sp. MJ-SS2]
MKALIPAFLAALLALHPAAAQADPYSDMVQTRILQGWRMADGRLMAGLEITLAPGWKTYWREPGDAGIPPLFDWSGSGNLRGVDINWPAPQVFQQSGSRSIGYSDRVILPLNISPRRDGRPVRLNGTIDIGICSDVCVPVRIELNEVLQGAATQPDPAIAAALAEKPFSGSEAGLKKSKCTVAPTSDGMALRAEFTLPSTGGREMAVVETGDPLIWASEPSISRKGGRLVAEFDLMHASGGPFAIDRSSLRFTILGKQYAVDVQGCEG